MQGQPYGQPQPMPGAGPMPPPGAPFGPGRAYVGLILIGIIILLIGGMIYASHGFLDDEDEDYYDSVRVTKSVGIIVQYIGLILMSIGMLIGAVRDDTLHHNVRLGILIAMGLIIGFRIWSVAV